MPKDTKTLGNNKARACESLGFVHKKGCVRVLTQPLCFNAAEYSESDTEVLSENIWLPLSGLCLPLSSVQRCDFLFK